MAGGRGSGRGCCRCRWRFRLLWAIGNHQCVWKCWSGLPGLVLSADYHNPRFDELAREPDAMTLFLDIETTGLRMTDRIVEVGVVDNDGQTVFSSLINPEVPIPTEATAVHGITDQMVCDAPYFDTIQGALHEILARDGTVVIYAMPTLIRGSSLSDFGTTSTFYVRCNATVSRRVAGVSLSARPRQLVTPQVNQVIEPLLMPRPVMPCGNGWINREARRPIDSQIWMRRNWPVRHGKPIAEQKRRRRNSNNTKQHL